MADLTATAPLLTDRLQRAFALASEVHATQVRKGRCIPHLAHLMSVAARALEHGGGENAAIGGLLHDAVEDASDGTQTEARIRRQFGDRVADIVIACSDAVAVSGRPETAMAIARRSTSGTCRETDHAVLLVSACDKLHNARTIVADLRAIGPALWDRFNEKDPAPQLWYYKSLADCYRGRVPAGLSDELTRVVNEMQSLRGRQRSDTNGLKRAGSSPGHQPPNRKKSSSSCACRSLRPPTGHSGPCSNSSPIRARSSISSPAPVPSATRCSSVLSATTCLRMAGQARSLTMTQNPRIAALNRQLLRISWT